MFAARRSCSRHINAKVTVLSCSRSCTTISFQCKTFVAMVEYTSVLTVIHVQVIDVCVEDPSEDFAK